MAALRSSFLAFLFSYALLQCGVAGAADSDLPPITVKGSKFFINDGEQFFIKGVAYQTTSSASSNDTLSNDAQCARDAPLIQKLGANVIRVYSVNSTQNHDACMKTFAEAGIYVFLDLARPVKGAYIAREDPEWTTDLRKAYAATIDEFQQYSNTAGFFVGNEVIDSEESTIAAPVLKAAASDMKAYIDYMGYRKIPIGYAAMDSTILRPLTQDYFGCGDSTSTVDFLAYNLYSWCGNVTVTQAGYDDILYEAQDYPFPLFLSETGCKSNDEPRTFGDQQALLTSPFLDQFSGSIIYEWAQEENGYGLVSYRGSSTQGTPTPMSDYTNLSKRWATLTPTGSPASLYTPDLAMRACPSSAAGTWGVKAVASLPTLGTSGLPAVTHSTITTLADVQATSGTTTDFKPQSLVTDAKPTTEATQTAAPVAAPSISGGAIAGIVIGVISGFALIGGFLLFFLRRRKRYQRAPEDDPGHVTSSPDYRSRSPFPSHTIYSAVPQSATVPIAGLEVVSGWDFDKGGYVMASEREIYELGGKPIIPEMYGSPAYMLGRGRGTVRSNYSEDLYTVTPTRERAPESPFDDGVPISPSLEPPSRNVSNAGSVHPDMMATAVPLRSVRAPRELEVRQLELQQGRRRGMRDC